MGLEARSTEDSTMKRDLLGKVRVCKTRLANLRDDYEGAKGVVERMSLGLGRDEEMGGGGGGVNGGGRGGRQGGSAREKLLHQSESLNSQNETLSNAQRIMVSDDWLFFIYLLFVYMNIVVCSFLFSWFILGFLYESNVFFKLLVRKKIGKSLITNYGLCHNNDKNNISCNTICSFFKYSILHHTKYTQH